MERILLYEKFRNLGLNEPEKLVLNNTLEKGRMGNLIILVGANNSGKSNVLGGLVEFGSESLQDRDITTLSYDPEYRKPKLTLVSKTNGLNYKCELSQKGIVYSYPSKTVDWTFDFEIRFDEIRNGLIYLRDITYRRRYDNSLSNKFDEFYGKISENRNNKEMLMRVFRDFVIIFKKYCLEDNIYLDAWNEFVRQYPNNQLAIEFDQIFNENKHSKEIYLKSYKDNFNINGLPNIYNYVDSKISNNDLNTTISNLNNNKFLLNVLNKIGVKIEEIKNAYSSFEKLQNRGALKKLEKSINRKLESISKDFNKLYFADAEKYSFEITLESTKIFFSLYRGNGDISLDYQSTGFKWFFDLYFNLLCKNALEPGDIIIMDEPATNLHVMGQRELRKFLKEFAIKNDLTIILATHVPFLIDLDYLDELRVISNKDNISYIANDYSTINLDDPDSLKPIKEALTVNNHVLLDPDRKVIFVEGITDYNYLLAMKQKLNIEGDITFLPIKGLGNVREPGIKEKQKQISKELIKIKKHNPILLVDADKAGLSMKNINGEDSELTVIPLSQADPNFKNIEDLFSREDLEKLGLIDNKGKIIKYSSMSSLIKLFVDEYEFSADTLENFRKLFKEFENL